MNNYLRVFGLFILAITFIIFLPLVSSTNWDISTASWNQSLDIGAKEIQPDDLFFSADGTKMYIAGEQSTDILQYSLSANWNVATATYSKSFDVGTKEIWGYGLFFKPDGTKMYITGVQNDIVQEYNLSTGWDIASAVWSQGFYIGGEEAISTAVFFNSDGSKMYITGATGDDVNEYNLSIGWNVVTATYSQTFYIGAKETYPQGMFFKSDGTKMYITGGHSDSVHEYNLSIGWNVVTAVFSQSLNISDKQTNPQGIFFKSDGTKMYVTGFNEHNVSEYDLPGVPEDTCSCPSINTNWNISMADYCNITDACDLGTGKMSFYESGYCSVDAIIHTTNLGDPGVNGLLKILSNALIWIKG